MKMTTPGHRCGRHGRRSSRGQAALEYVLVISVLSIALYFSTGIFVQMFGEGMTVLTNEDTGLAASLTTDGIRP